MACGYADAGGHVSLPDDPRYWQWHRNESCRDACLIGRVADGLSSFLPENHPLSPIAVELAAGKIHSGMSKPAVLGVDVGGTKTLCLLVSPSRRIIAQTKFKTAPGEGCDLFARNLVKELKGLAEHARKNRFQLAGIGVGVAGTVERKNGIIKTSPNLLCLEGFPMRRFLQRSLKLPVALDNDVQLGVLAEHRLGAGRGCDHILGVFFGTGVGGAAILNGELYRGASDVGGQVGAVLAQPVGGPEAALSHGILDRIASKAAIASEALVMAVKNWAPYLHKKVEADLSKVSWGMLKRAIAHGDNRVEEMLRARMKVVGIALSNIVNFINPQMLVLGGGLMDEMPKLVLAEVGAGLREYLVSEVAEVFKIRRARLGGYAVALGAADIAFARGPSAD